ncbi:endonuclease domain-containing protein [Martelella soudanensis]|uniref:endonuclease domain-containing protein n=1 Tax=unclassified Martelella TaxID=2629616 RepID=UPI0015DF964C|nr:MULTISPECIES: endonuclease domain-containing protein [unclassified Martelella]
MPNISTQYARALRRNETDAEKMLWREIRNRNLNGFKFVRQYPIGPYITDFACREKALVVELDGAQHAENIRDVERTRYINRTGFSVIRFWNEEVLREPDDVLETIVAILEGRLKEACNTTRFHPATEQIQ